MLIPSCLPFDPSSLTADSRVLEPTFLGTTHSYHEYTQLENTKSAALEFNSSMDKRAFDRMMHEMPSDVRDLLCFAIWIDSGCPDEPGFGERVLYEYPWIVFEKSAPLISHTGGNFLEQTLHYLHLRLEEKRSAVAIDQLNKLKWAAERSQYISYQNILPEVFEALAQRIYEIGLDHNKEWKYGENWLTKDARCIFWKTETDSLADELIKRYEARGKDHNYFLTERPMRVFEAMSPRCSLTQRRALYNALPEGDKRTIGRRIDAPYWGIGIETSLHHFYGAHVQDGSTVFRIYAPHAREVRIKIHWEHDPIEVRPLMGIGNGNYETTFWKEMENVPYEYEIVMNDGRVLTKTDPFARGHCLRPDSRAVVRRPWFHWEDHEWMRDRTNGDGVPRSTYKVILGAWTDWKDYKGYARELASYCKEMGFTHVELPICEYQTDGSLGYQAFGFFAPTSRFGSLHDFQAFVNILHQEGIGVVIDLPTHFVPENWSLNDVGIYEGGDTRFGTKSFNWGNPFVRNYYISAARALFELHVDGIRLDFVEQMLDCPYGHLALQELSTCLHAEFPTAFLIAENAHDAKDTHAVPHGGLGFDRQVAMAESSMLVREMEKPFHERNMHEVGYVVDMLSRDRGILAFSHDVYPAFYGDWWKRKAQMRLLFGMMAGLNGDSLCYMGHELGFEHRSDPHHALAWYAAQNDLKKLVGEINHLHLRTKALWRCASAEVVARDDHSKVMGILRRASDGSQMVVIANFGAEGFEHFFLPMRRSSESLREVFNTDAAWFGGTGSFMNREIHVEDRGIQLKLPPLGVVFAVA